MEILRKRESEKMQDSEYFIKRANEMLENALKTNSMKEVEIAVQVLNRAKQSQEELSKNRKEIKSVEKKINNKRKTLNDSEKNDKRKKK